MSRPKYKKQAGKYRYVLTEDWTVFVPYVWWQHAAEYRHHGLTWMTCQWCYITLKKGYAIDGATCAPDVELWMEWFFLHDALCQFCHHPKATFTRKNADIAMKHGMDKTNATITPWIKRKAYESLAKIYFAGVRIGAKMPPKIEPDMEIIKL